jgi:Fe-S-cluster-containing dehydrogenase component/DMSO reductase anchor subunit
MSDVQKGFRFDLNRCTGCGACVVACCIENHGRQAINWRQVFTFNETCHPEIARFSLSMACNHCGSPACMENCPALAISKDAETGSVTVNPDLCMGCKYCTWACPYDAPQYNPGAGIVEKCDFCVERLRKDEAPACVCSCPTNALLIEDSQPGNNTQSQQVEGFTEAGLKPALHCKPLRKQQRVPELSAPPANEAVENSFNASLQIPLPKITLKSEWTLLTFTSIAYILVALFTASLVVPIALNPFVFLGAGVLGMGLSSVHLGQKSRAFRAIFNIKRSWLSREIFLFSLFLALSLSYMLLPGQPVLGWTAAVFGFLSLFAVDRIYQVAMHTGPANFHSAHTLFNGLYLAGILTANPFIFGGAGLVKLVLYLHRKWLFKKLNRATYPWLSLVRLALGFLFPVTITLKPGLFANYAVLLAAACVIAAELIDRAEFYHELDIITPSKQMLIDLERLLKKPQTDTD